MRINNDNYDEYINSNYPRAIFIKEETYYDEPYYLQKNFGGLNDCTIMSISYMIKQKNIMRLIDVIYETVEKAAKCYFYKENIGTIPVFINSIIKKAYNMKGKGGYFKNIGFNIKTILKNLPHSPVILSMYNDGNNYYKNHSVTIVGYKQYSYNNKDIYLLEIRDNWNKTASYVDYQKLSNISSINYLI